MLASSTVHLTISSDVTYLLVAPSNVEALYSVSTSDLVEWARTFGAHIRSLSQRSRLCYMMLNDTMRTSKVHPTTLHLLHSNKVVDWITGLNNLAL